jgi:hypothetical protein
VLLTINGYSTLEIYHDFNCRLKLIDDYLHKNLTKPEAENELLKDLEKLFTSHGKSLSDYGLPKPEEDKTEYQRAMLRIDRTKEAELYRDLLASNPPTEEQKKFINEIIEMIDNRHNVDYVGGNFLLQGEGGSGKSTVAKIITAYAKSKGLLVQGCASTGLAASIYEDYTTAHNLFSIPVVKDEELYVESEHVCGFYKNEQRKDLLFSTKIFIWDEISSSHVRDFKAVFKAMNKFEGKIFIGLGDCMQITPVVTSGTKDEILRSSIYCSEYLDQFQIFKFTINLRIMNASDNIDESNYSKMLLELGKGTYGLGNNNLQDDIILSPEIPTRCNYYDEVLEIVDAKYVCFPKIPFISEQKLALDYLYPDGFDTTTIINTCIIASTNERVAFWNDIVQKLNNENGLDPETFRSRDFIGNPIPNIL